MNTSFTRSGNIVDILNRRVFPGTVHVVEGKIARVIEDPQAKTSEFILPGFIDAHIHIESSMVIPSEFARLATVHGTVATISDPHEIANVLGVKGIRFMIENGKKVPFHFYFGASSCVPATQFETAGAAISARDIEELFMTDKLKYLSEMMNFPGVLNRDPEVMKKIEIARRLGRPVDGHAPGLKGEKAQHYAEAGITTDHECVEYEEAVDKIKCGMKILIREGSAAKNFEALHPLLRIYPAKVMFCSDDKHPHELVEGHINLLVRRSIDLGYDLMDVLRAACVHPIEHYNLEVGLLRPYDNADFIIVNNLRDFDVKETYIKGIKVAEKGRPLIESVYSDTPNHFNAKSKSPQDFAIVESQLSTHVIVAEDGQLITHSQLVSDVHGKDILKLAVVNRYQDAKPAIGYIKNFGLKRGAIASCVAHDSHNIIAVGCSDEEICEAVNLLIKNKGGLSAVDGKENRVLALPVAGIMTNEDGYRVAEEYASIDHFAKELGSALAAPYMTLSFMALLVIPELKLSDKGLFDVQAFQFIPLHVKDKIRSDIA
jgi:adenine deaminase